MVSDLQSGRPPGDCRLLTADCLAEWVGRLVRIPSVTPSHAGRRAQEPGEGRLAAAVAGWFAESGGEVFREEPLPGRPNVYGIWRGSSDRWAALDVHLDTVGVEQMAGDPFDGRLADGRVYGRGAVDTKASLGVALALLEALHARGGRPAANLIIAATVDEEADARGAPTFAAWLRQQSITVDELAVAEPTGCGPVFGHRGVLRLEFCVRGVAAHSAQPELGRNAITAAARLALALEAEHRRLQEQPVATPLGPPSLTVTLIAGGRGLNVVPDSCTLALDRRTVPGERLDSLAAGLTDLAHTSCGLPVEVGTCKRIDAFLQSPDTPWLRRLAAWSDISPSVAPYCCNAWAYRDVAREVAVLGPGSIAQAHGDEEWVATSELLKLSGIYATWWGIEC